MKDCLRLSIDLRSQCTGDMFLYGATCCSNFELMPVFFHGAAFAGALSVAAGVARLLLLLCCCQRKAVVCELLLAVYIVRGSYVCMRGMGSRVLILDAPSTIEGPSRNLHIRVQIAGRDSPGVSFFGHRMMLKWRPGRLERAS